MPIFPSNDDAEITPGHFGYQCTSKFQLVPAGNSDTICKSKKNTTISTSKLTINNQKISNHSLVQEPLTQSEGQQRTTVLKQKGRN